MNTTTQKQELIDWIDQIEDKALLDALQTIKNNQASGDWWDDLPQAVKDSIDEGIADADAGRVISSEQFWKQYEQYL